MIGAEYRESMLLTNMKSFQNNSHSEELERASHVRNWYLRKSIKSEGLDRLVSMFKYLMKDSSIKGRLNV